MALLEVEIVAYRGLNVFESLVVELDDVAAFDANQVVVVLAAVDLLVERLTCSDVQAFDELAFLKQFQRTVDGGSRYPGVVVFQLLDEIFRLEVARVAEYLVNHRLPLAGVLEFLSFQEVREIRFFPFTVLFATLSDGIRRFDGNMLCLDHENMPKQTLYAVDGGKECFLVSHAGPAI